MIWVASGATEIGRLDYLKRTGKELKSADGVPSADEIKTDYASQGQAILIQTYRNYIHSDYGVRQVLVQARAGVDLIAPSGMMDGMVRAIRGGLDREGFERIPIMSYSAKYAGAFYGPFRDAAERAPRFGGRRMAPYAA